MEHSVSSRTGERSRPALLVSAVLALLVALTTLLAPGLASSASAAEVIENRVLPTISGTAGVGETLSVDTGVWSPTGVTLSVQWLRGATEIEGATEGTYSPDAADKNQQLAVRVTASKTDSTSVQKESVLTVAIKDCTGLAGLTCLTPNAKPKASPTNSAVPEIGGTVQVGAKLTAAPGTWSSGACTAQTCKYQWYAGAVPVDGANGLEFTPTAAEQGKKLTIKEWATSADGLSGSVSSVETAVVERDPNQPRANTALPVITNPTPRVGDTLYVTPGSWSPAPADVTDAYVFQWLVGGVEVANPNSYPYFLKITDEMVGKRVSARVTAKASEGVAEASATSAQTEPVRAAGTSASGKVEPAMTVNVKVKRSGKVVVKAKVTAVGHSPVTGQAKVKVTRGGGKAVTVDLINGKVKLSWAKLKKGKHKAKVTYLGNDQLERTAKVVVPFTKR